MAPLHAPDEILLVLHALAVLAIAACAAELYRTRSSWLP